MFLKDVDEAQKSEVWRSTMVEEMRALRDNKSWEVVCTPDEAHLVGSK